VKKIYFDNVSTTSLHEEVLKTYKDLLDKYYCNSDALYDDGVVIYDMQEKSRALIAELLKVDKDEVIFTSGASEANSLAIKGLCLNQSERKHLITTIYEHSSAYNAFKQLEEHFGFEVTYLMPEDKSGQISADQLKKAIRKDTLLVSVMAVNNEIGIINDIKEIKELIKHYPGLYFHCDLTQAVGKIPFDLQDIDLASFSAHKIHGLKGSGVLVKKRHVGLLPLINGGQQESGIRGGTSNALCNIVLAKTLRLALEEEDKYHAYMLELGAYFKERIKEVEGIKINSPEGAIYNLINIETPLTSEVMLNALNLKNIMVSSKSTCGSRKNESNRTLKSMGIDDDHAIRVSFDHHNTKEEIDYFIDSIKEIIKKYA